VRRKRLRNRLKATSNEQPGSRKAARNPGRSRENPLMGVLIVKRRSATITALFKQEDSRGRALRETSGNEDAGDQEKRKIVPGDMIAQTTPLDIVGP